jgi:hypothetical protein
MAYFIQYIFWGYVFTTRNDIFKYDELTPIVGIVELRQESLERSKVTRFHTVLSTNQTSSIARDAWIRSSLSSDRKCWFDIPINVKAKRPSLSASEILSVRIVLSAIYLRRLAGDARFDPLCRLTVNTYLTMPVKLKGKTSISKNEWDSKLPYLPLTYLLA